MVWPCFAARVPMAVAMLPEPMMLMVVMTCVPLLCVDQLIVGVLLVRAGPGCRRLAGAQVSDRPTADRELLRSRTTWRRPAPCPLSHL
jgi:hypothetical protein